MNRKSTLSLGKDGSGTTSGLPVVGKDKVASLARLHSWLGPQSSLQRSSRHTEHLCTKGFWLKK